MWIARGLWLLGAVCIFVSLDFAMAAKTLPSQMDGMECSGKGWTIQKFGDKYFCYKTVTVAKKVKKTEALIEQNHCKSLDQASAVASIHSKQEDLFLQKTFGPVFIGLFQPGKGKWNPKLFKWSDGTPLDYVGWDKLKHLKPQPNNDKPKAEERVTRLRKNKQYFGWHDWPASSIDVILCKKLAVQVVTPPPKTPKSDHAVLPSPEPGVVKTRINITHNIIILDDEQEETTKPPSGRDTNIVVWDIDKCWNWFANKTNVCAEGGKLKETERANVERYVGAFCFCLGNTVGDGFSCIEQCERKKHPEKMQECSRQRRQCQIDPKTGEPFCGCLRGHVYRTNPGGHGYCEKVDQCASCQHKCHKASKCMPSTDSFSAYSCSACNPKFGYRGDGVLCDNIDECADDRLNDCDRPNAFCDDRDPVYDDGLKYECSCQEGWLGDPEGGYKWRPCQDTNECLNKTICGDYANCVNTPGSFKCECKPGFTKKPGNPRECVDINECVVGKPCHELANCNNTIGSYKCSCKTGYIGDGVKECKPDKEYWCKRCNGASTNCVLRGNAYVCVCKPGFRPIESNPHMCADIDECRQPHLNDCDKTPGRANCSNVPGSYKCTCNKGYEGNGKVCKPTDPCEISYPCSTIANTFCFNNNGKAECRCKNGTIRQIADTKNMTAPCYEIDSSPVNNCTLCDNSTSMCTKIAEDLPFMQCVCRAGYKRNSAGHCVNINECRHAAEHDCDDNAICHDRVPHIHGKRYECECKQGYQGSGKLDHCKDVDECKNSTYPVCPDLNTSCKNTIGSYTCECKAGFRKLKNSDVCANINECEEGTAKCPVQAVCVDLSPFYRCDCRLGFRNITTADGKLDCINIDECKEGIGADKQPPCDPEHGICKDTFGSYSCVCEKGFVRAYDGKSCTDLNECKQGVASCNPMLEECENTIGSFKCNCRYGLHYNETTKTCQDRNECADGSNKCSVNSKCINTFASYKCECEEGFKPVTGAHPLRPACERENICIKLPSICDPGKCESTETAPHYYKCHCPPSSVILNDTKCVFPNYCDKDFPCPAHAVCVGHQCACNVGYNWQDITRFPITVNALKNRPPCKEINPCLDQQLCREPLKCRHIGPGKHTCDCQAGFELIEGQCFDIDECHLKIGGAKCPERSACKNLVGSYKCECKPGFVAKLGSSLTAPNCIDVNECEAGTHDCHKKNATCVNTVGSFECKCSDGYRTQAPDYTICRDVDECKEDTHTCDKENAFCTNVPGSYDCKCKKGFFGDGETCIDVDECNPADPKHNCTDTMECINMPGTFNCTCKPGYQLTEQGCVDIDECLSLENNNCSKIGGEVRMKCINEPGSYSCVCPAGYAQLSPEKCVDVDECKAVPSVCPTFDADICVNTNGSFTCGCKKGFAKPKRCTDKTKCACADIDECLVGIHVDGKFRAACGPAAKCENRLGSFSCECAPGYEGDPYSTGCKIADACKVKNPCDKDTEVCVNANGKAVCSCKKGFLTTNNKKCQKNPCANKRGGCGKTSICTPVREEEIIKAVCKCKVGYKLDSNKECKRVDQCECKTPVPLGHPCKSKVRCAADHMLCVTYGHDANCTCETGYKLSKDMTACENIDECREGVLGNKLNIACAKDARCIDTVGSFSCDCPRGQIENHDHKCVIDVGCSRERGCAHDPNTFCASINETRAWCQCKAGFEGTGKPSDGICTPENFCNSAKKAAKGKDVCPVNEHCENTDKSYKCVCDSGFERDSKTGKCEDINECVLGFHSCRATYQCINTIGSYKCECPSGYRHNVTDHRCDDIDECLEGIANCTKPQERCQNLPGSFRCECATPQFIDSVHGCVDNNECEANLFNCTVNSNCNNTIGGYDCVCKQGFIPIGKDPKRPDECRNVNECENKNACPKFSKCKDLPGSYECICLPPTIQHGPQDCVTNASCPDDCHKNAFCLKSTRENGDVYNCTCSAGYSGDGVKECTPIDECALGIAKCHKNANCIDETPLYRCECKEPFEGDGKNVCNWPDICKKYNDCPVGAECVPLKKKEEGKWVSCKCIPGFVFNPKTRLCDDIDECLQKPCPTTPKGVKCKNTQGSFSCECPVGYRNSAKNFTICEDIDECLGEGNIVCAKQSAKCENLPGDYQCQCPKGFRKGANNKICLDIDECKEGLDDCDKNTTHCHNTVPGYKCVCNKGLAKIPTKNNICEDINECELQLHNCLAGSELCHNTLGSFACNCSNGYHKVKESCLPFSDCDMECGANAICVTRASRKDPSKKTPTCVCQDGFYGKDPKEFCDPVPDCEKDYQCPTNSRCVESQVTDKKGRATFQCVCNYGYTKEGSQCRPINECEEFKNVCNGTALCVDMTPGYRCECPPHEINIGKGEGNVTCAIPKCSDVVSPCHADAECVDQSHGFSCRCKPGFRGVGTSQLGCEVIDQCKEYTPCSQYATCVNQPRGSFTCTCRTGYTGNGTICHDINECLNPKACDVEATCTNNQGSYNCHCNPGYTGSGFPGQCVDVNECKDPRLNKCDPTTTNCVNNIGSFTCQCKDGFEPSPTSNFTCGDINECLWKKKVCDIHKCNNLFGSYRCDCNTGYKASGDGKQCNDINECDARPCHVQASCTNTPGSYSCACNEGYTGDGKECTPINKCSKDSLNSCNKNTTKCVQVENTGNYRCECLDGYIPPLNITGPYFTCIDEDECQTGKAKFDPLTQICVNKEPGYEIHCKPGFDFDPKNKARCIDHDECKDDPAFEETLKKFLAAKKAKKPLGDWKEWMVAPKNKSSAYGICFSKAMESKYWWFTSASHPLPFCLNTAYNPAGAFPGKFNIPSWKGFECTCAPGNKPSKSQSSIRVCITCAVEDPCEALKCDSLGEGYVCNREAGRCVCDASKGYVSRIVNNTPFCTRDECTNADTAGPTTVANIHHRSLIQCDYSAKRWIEPKGWRFVRDNVTSVVIGLEDINECLIDDYCCNHKAASCKSHGGTNDCKIKCENFDGGAACYCGLNNTADFEVDRNTCQCIPKCGVNSAWYLNCVGDRLQCNSALWKRLASAPTAPKGPVCSRIIEEKYITYPSIFDLVMAVCNNNFYCAQPHEQIDDIRKHPAFNYEGKCIEHVDQASNVKCPFGDKPEVSPDNVYAFCPFKVDLKTWPGPSPTYIKREGVNMPLNCLNNGLKLSINTLFIKEANGYSLDA